MSKYKRAKPCEADSGDQTHGGVVGQIHTGGEREGGGLKGGGGGGVNEHQLQPGEWSAATGQWSLSA